MESQKIQDFLNNLITIGEVIKITSESKIKIRNRATIRKYCSQKKLRHYFLKNGNSRVDIVFYKPFLMEDLKNNFRKI